MQPQRLRVEALVLLPTQIAMLVGQAWLPDGATVTPDDEHDEFAWWPEDVDRWPAEADEPLRRVAALLTQHMQTRSRSGAWRWRRSPIRASIWRC